MKTTQLFLAVAFLSLTLTNSAFGQTKITLIVDTNDINSQNYLEKCSFEGQTVKDVRKHITDNVKLGEKITWTGRSKNGEDIIYIKMIRRQGGPNIFNSQVIEAISRPGKEKPDRDVIGIVYYATERGNDYKYKISFSINDKPRTYGIDPLIRTNVQTDIGPQ